MNICRNDKCRKETKNPQFCSRKCSAIVTNALEPKRKKTSNGNNFCETCEKSLLGRSGKKYCSRSCSSEGHRKTKLEDAQTDGVRKKILLKLLGHCCSICGLREWLDKPIPLILDHIDGNSYNNEEVNLRLVCGNCDMQLPTYKSKNNGNGRHSRRQRYKEGKSY